MSLKRELEFAVDVAREAGAFTLKHFDSGIEPSWKEDSSPVTVADLGAEDLIRERIGAVFPTDAILGEERSDKAGTSGRRWVIDPIDGTRSFVQGVPLYAVLLALETESDDDQLLGVVYLPGLDEIVYAARGEGCFRNGDRARVSSVSNIDESCFTYTSLRNFEEAAVARGRPVHQELARRCGVLRGWGDAYGYVLIATGRAEAMFDPIIKPWDIAPMVPIVEEAGGKLTDWDGRRSIRSGHCVATNGVIHDEVLEMLRGEVEG